MEIRKTAQALYWRAASPLYRQYLRLSGVRVDNDVSFRGAPYFSIHPDSSIRIGARTRLVSNTALSVLTTGPCVVRTKAASAAIDIGDDVGITGSSIIARSRISIGARVMIGRGSIISDSSAHPIDEIPRRYSPAPSPSPADSISIHDDVFVGANVVIMPGVTIGAGSVIGAGSIVTKSIPAGVVAAGNPARVIRQIGGA